MHILKKNQHVARFSLDRAFLLTADNVQECSDAHDGCHIFKRNVLVVVQRSLGEEAVFVRMRSQ